MAINTNFNTNPYFDDFNEEKDFLRILFRPGVAVQARELTQIQSILQNQIEKFGNHIFEDGSKVIGGNITIDTDVQYLKLFSTYEAQNSTVVGQSIDLSKFDGQIIEQVTTGAKARVIHIEEENIDPPTLYIKTINGIDFIENSSINDATIKTTIDGIDYFARVGGSRQNISGVIGDATGTGSIASIDDGIFYVSGFFVRCGKQTINLQKYENIPSVRVGLVYTESILQEFDDDSLLDPANGSPNFTAPGAHRFKMSLQLTKVELNTERENFIELARIDDGIIQRLSVNPIYSELGKQLAKRTYDESGNYTVRPFNINLENYEPVDANKFKAILDSGKAYVHGFEYETIGTELVDIDRSLETEFVDDRQMYVRFGNYTVIDNIVGLFDTDTQQNVDLYAVTTSQISNTSLELIGTANVISYVKSGSDTRLYLRNLSYNTITVQASTQTILGGSQIVLDAGSDIDQAYKGMTIEVNSIRYTITDYNGTTKTVTVDNEFSFNITSTIDVNIIPNSKNINSFVSGSKSSDVSLSAKVNGLRSNATIFYETDLSNLVFPMNDSYVKSLRENSINARYTYTKKVQITFNGGTGSFTETTTSDEIYPGVQGALQADDYNRFLIYKQSDGTEVTISAATVTDKTITFTTADVTEFVADVYILIQSEGATERTKTYVSANTSVLQTNTTAGLNVGQLVIADPNKVAGISESLLVSDVYKVKKIVDIGRSSIQSDFDVANTDTWIEFTSSVYDETNADITSNYKFYDGQKDYLYDHASITLLAGKSTPIGPIIVFFDYFEPSPIGSQQGFFSVDSYQGINYEDIPIYKSQSGAQSLRLTDALDFRPIREKNSNSFDGGVRLPNPLFVFTTDYNYYLSRIDKIVLTKEREFQVLKGISSTSPVPPSDLDSAMTLYTISLPPFTSDLSKVSIDPIDNSRYTMKDIGQLAQRIRILESDAILNKLERETLDSVIFDELGVERFINGALVDNFTGHSIGDVENIDYNVAVDFQNRELRPPFTSNAYNLDVDVLNSSNYSVLNNLVTMDYVESEFAIQGLASKTVNVNPYNVFNFNGSVKLNPTRDVWFDTTTRPAVSINLEGDNDAWSAIGRAVEDSRNNGFGTEWNDWQTRWTGTSTTSRIVDEDVDVEVDGRRITATKTTTTEQVVTRNRQEIRTGTRTSFGSRTITRNAGSRIVDISVVPFIRSKNVEFTIEGCKPGTTLYAFFDGVNVSNQITPTGGVIGDPIVTDASGKATGVFSILGGKFRTGDRVLRFIDREDNNVKLSNTKAEGTYSAQGTLTTTEDVVVSVRQPVVRTQTVREARPMPDVVTRTLTTSENTTTTWIDPLAQSFLVDPRLYPSGTYISSIDLFFAKKDDNLPITLQIRPTINGYPSSSIIVPGSEVTLDHDQVNTSDNPDINTSDTITTFTFDNLVYLEPGEYTFVVLSNSNQYELYVGEIGQKAINGNFLITENPFAGVMFKSQNASTWTAVQEDDIMFNIKRASFDTNLATTVKFDIDLNEITEETLYEVFQVTSHDYKPKNTNVTYTYDYVTNLNNTVLDLPLTPNDNIVLRNKGKIANTINSFSVTAVMETSDDAVSPMLDNETLQLISISNNISNGGITRNSIVIENGGSGYANTDLVQITSSFGSGGAIEIITDNTGTIIDYTIIEPGSGYVTDVTLNVSSGTGTNAILKFIGETSNEGGNATARYITRKVTLAKGFDSNYMQVRFKAYRPAQSNIDVYYKVLNANDTNNIDDKDYVKMEIDPSTDKFSSKSNEYLEFIYKPKDGNISYTSGSNEYTDFNTFLIKIVLRSSGTTNFEIPKIRDMKAIAFAP